MRLAKSNSQSTKISSDSDYNSHVLRDVDSLRPDDHVSYRRKDQQISGHQIPFPPSISPDSQAVVEIVGTSSFAGEAHYRRETQDEGPPISSPLQLVQVSRDAGQSRTLGGVYAGLALVEKAKQPSQRKVTSEIQPGFDPVYRCLDNRMGKYHTGQDGSRDVV